MKKYFFGSALISFLALSLPLTALALAMPQNGVNVNLSVQVGQSVEITLPISPSGQWILFNLTGESVASGVVINPVVRITGNAAGRAYFLVCADTSKIACHEIRVGVSNEANGLVLGVSTESHDIGSWVKHKNTVYYVHQNGLIPVPSMKVFVNNGGIAREIQPMSDMDMQLPPYLPELGLNDSRIR